MSMISGKLGEDKQNKQEKSETAIRESIGVVPLALPLMAGPGAISSPTGFTSANKPIKNLKNVGKSNSIEFKGSSADW